VTVVSYASGWWKTMGNAGFSGASAYPISLAIDLSGFPSKGTPYVAYQDDANGGRATVMRYANAAGWQTVGPACFSPGAAIGVTLAIDNKSGTPYVAYTENSVNGSKATVMCFK
jgi:hypothetical protein